MPASVLLLRRAPWALFAVVALGASACVGERPTLADEVEPTTTVAETTTTQAAEAAEVAQANEPSIDVFTSEDAEDPDRQIVSGVDTSVDTIPVVFLVKRSGSDRVEVYLPVTPHGSTGWVAADEVTVTSVPYRIEVGLSEHRIRVFEGAEVIVDEPVGVGRTDRPAPGSFYFLKELLEPPDPDGPYGSFAYGLSGYPNVLPGFDGRPGVVGIHGTDNPSAVGTDTSSGSIRLANEVIERLVNDIGLPLGTPVAILA